MPETAPNPATTAADGPAAPMSSGMDPSPQVPSCALDGNGLRVQRERYRRVGQRARLVDRTGRKLVVELDPHVDPRVVDDLIVVERACCPFFELGWDRERRRLTVSVSQKEHEPALDAIAFALDLETTARHAASD